MSNRKTSSKSSPTSLHKTKITNETLQILMKEFDTMKELFSETQTSIQGIFNFYITLVTAVIGGVALVLQFPSSTPSDTARSQVVICALFFLSSVIGTIYLLSIVYRYSRLVEYGQNLDALRLLLFQEFDVPLPSIYSQFLEEHQEMSSTRMSQFSWLAWLLPTGTYQLTMAFINSGTLAVATWILLSILGATSARYSESLVTVLVEFFLVFNLYNIYSRITLKYWTTSFRLHLNPHVESSFRMIR